MGYTRFQVVAETTVFARRAAELLTEDEHQRLVSFLAGHPTAGEVIVGTGGVRKMRFAAKGRGKSGGVRCIYYVYDDRMPIYALLLYGKGERADLTPEERKRVSAMAQALKQLGMRHD